MWGRSACSDSGGLKVVLSFSSTFDLQHLPADPDSRVDPCSATHTTQSFFLSLTTHTTRTPHIQLHNYVQEELCVQTFASGISSAVGGNRHLKKNPVYVSKARLFYSFDARDAASCDACDASSLNLNGFATSKPSGCSALTYSLKPAHWQREGERLGILGAEAEQLHRLQRTAQQHRARSLTCAEGTRNATMCDGASLPSSLTSSTSEKSMCVAMTWVGRYSCAKILTFQRRLELHRRTELSFNQEETHRLVFPNALLVQHPVPCRA